jgi:hypothetical protein
MKLVPASSPGMEAAHKHSYVQTIVKLLLQDRNLLRPSAMFLKQYTSCDQQGFEEKLEALRLLQSRPDVNGTVEASDHASELTKALQNLYRQKDQMRINYQRGAIVESLVCKLICHRYNGLNETCLNNQRFVDNYKDITVQEVDVAALSNSRQKVEGYECKVNPAAFEPYDCINLSNLADAAKERNYRSHVGFVSFENDSVVKLKLVRLRLPSLIKLYGLDTIESLQQLPHLEN